MSSILIIYDSASGNTEKMAHAVAEGAETVKDTKVITKKVDQANVEDLLEADGIIMGSPVYFGQMSTKMKDFIDRSLKVYGKLDGKVGAAFTSSGGTVSGAETTLLSIIHAMLIHGLVVMGRSKETHYGAAAVGSPGAQAIEGCRNLGHKTASLVAKLTK
jgi:NAD(P)H dehydrogenase (quinone)